MFDLILDTLKVVSADVFSGMGIVTIVTGLVAGTLFVPFLKRLVDVLLIKYMVAHGQLDKARALIEKHILDNYKKFDRKFVNKLKEELPETGQAIEDLFIDTFQKLIKITKE